MCRRMRKKVYLFICLSLVSFTHCTQAANEKFFCAIPRALEFKDIVIKMPGTDKAKHCSISCIVALKCGGFETYLFGLSKEIYDAFGGGTPDQADIEANKAGIKLATSSIAQNSDDCLRECLTLYPKKN